MDRNKGIENIIGKKENFYSKIPKSAKSSSAKEITSVITEVKETVQISKRTRKENITSTKRKQTETTNPQKNVKPMSIVTISKDVLKHIEIENVKKEDIAVEHATRIKVLDKENITKRAALKEKKSGNISKKPSASDLKPSNAFGGMRFATKKKTSQKADVFQKVTKKELPAVNPPESSAGEKTTAKSSKSVTNKKIEQSHNGTDTAESSKATALTMKEAPFIRFATFGGLRFSPKCQSTPLKPDLFDKIRKESKHDDNEMYPTDSSPECLLSTHRSTKAIVRKKAETATVCETVQSSTKEAEFLKMASSTLKEEESDKICIAFEGMRLKPKRKSTHPKPDIFERERKESINGYQEVHISEEASVEQKKMFSGTAQIMRKETQHGGKLDCFSIEQTRSSETVTITRKEIRRVAAFGDISIVPKLNTTSIRPDVFGTTQKESKTVELESHATVGYLKEMKKISGTSKAIMKVETQHPVIEKSQAPTTEEPESSKTDTAKNGDEVIPKPVQAFGGLRFKPKQKTLRDIFQTHV